MLAQAAHSLAPAVTAITRLRRNNSPRRDAFRFDIERIVALRPDLVLAWQSGTPESAIERLRALKLPVLVIGTHRLAGIAANLELLGRATGHEGQAQAAAHAFLSGLERLRGKYAGRKPVRVFYEISAAPLYTIGGSQIISRIIELCGGRNILPIWLRQPRR